MTKEDALNWKRRRDVAAEKEKELLRQTSDAVRFRQLQAMFSTVRNQNWQVTTLEDIDLVRARAGTSCVSWLKHIRIRLVVGEMAHLLEMPESIKSLQKLLQVRIAANLRVRGHF